MVQEDTAHRPGQQMNCKTRLASKIPSHSLASELLDGGKQKTKKKQNLMSSEVSSLSFCPQSHLWVKCQTLNIILVQINFGQQTGCSCSFPHLNSVDGEPLFFASMLSSLREHLKEHFRNGLTPNQPVKFLDTQKSPCLFLGRPRLPRHPDRQLPFPVSEHFIRAGAFLHPLPTKTRSAKT